MDVSKLTREDEKEFLKRNESPKRLPLAELLSHSERLRSYISRIQELEVRSDFNHQMLQKIGK